MTYLFADSFGCSMFRHFSERVGTTKLEWPRRLVATLYGPFSMNRIATFAEGAVTGRLACSCLKVAQNLMGKQDVGRGGV